MSPAALELLSFNPHPSRRTGATDAEELGIVYARRFNPHPSRRTGATQNVSRHSCWYAMFQSSPVPQDGCYGNHPRLTNLCRMFQSSPVPQDGCYMRELDIPLTLDVSILTRPAGRVLQRGSGTP